MMRFASVFAFWTCHEWFTRPSFGKQSVFEAATVIVSRRRWILLYLKLKRCENDRKEPRRQVRMLELENQIQIVERFIVISPGFRWRSPRGINPSWWNWLSWVNSSGFTGGRDTEGGGGGTVASWWWFIECMYGRNSFSVSIAYTENKSKVCKEKYQCLGQIRSK